MATRKKSASSGAAKKTAADASKSQKTNAQKSATAASKAEQNKNQVWAVILFAVGILLFTIIMIRGQNVWLFLHNMMFGIFGIGAFLVPILLLYVAIRITIRPDIGKIGNKMWQSLALMTLVCGMIQVIFIGDYAGDGFFSVISTLFEQGKAIKGGGVLSAVFGWPLMAACGRVGASIIMVLFVFALILLVTGATLLDAFRTVSKPVKHLEDQYVRIREERVEKVEARKKFNFNVDLGPEIEKDAVEKDPMPQHPVSSAKEKMFQQKDADFPELLESPSESPASAFLETVQKSKEKAAQNLESKKQEKQEQLEALVQKAAAQSPAEPVSSTDRDFLDIDPVDEDLQEWSQPSPQENSSAAVPNAEIPKMSEPETETQPTPAVYRFPPLSLLRAPVNKVNADLSEELKMNAELLVNTLKSFGVQTRIIDISRGPTVTRYELQPSAGVKISKITGLADDIALNLAAAGVRIEAPIPNKAAVGIEVPNKNTDIVTMREIVDSEKFRNAKSRLSVALGKDISGEEMIFDIAKMPHMLIAGSTGSGKSVCINSIIISLMYKATPDEVKLLMIDPKIVELGAYNGIPHLLVPVVTDPRKAAGALGWAVTEMLNRYQIFADNGARDLMGYNELAKTKEDLNPMPQIVIIIDELADLMMAAPNEVEDAIGRLAQMARAAGMHLVIATQRPSVDVITGVIKSNIPSRIAFAVSSQVDSRTILDQGGAEKLLGKGDMLFSPVGMPKPARLQGCFVTDQERDQIIEFVKNSGTSEYSEKIMDEIEKQAVMEKSKDKNSDGGGFEDVDPLLDQAIETIIEAGQASTSYLQRRLKVGYARAARLIDDMEAKGIVGPSEGSKPRQVLITRNQYIEMKMNQDAAEEAQQVTTGG